MIRVQEVLIYLFSPDILDAQLLPNKFPIIEKYFFSIWFLVFRLLTDIHNNE